MKRRLLFWVWLVYLLAWSAALMSPVPPEAVETLGSENAFTFSKTIHVLGYAVLTALTGSLGRPSWRWLLLVSAHALLTELLQYLTHDWLGRHGRWADVGLDHIGMAVGVAVMWRWWWGGRSSPPEAI